MRISIITATCNSAAHIADCIRSVNDQPHVDIEHIIVDGASKDDTLAVINAIPNRITKIISEPDQGIYDALNKGIRLATGDIIGFLHSDDTLASSSVIKTIQDTFEKTNADIVYGDLVYLDNKKQKKVLRYWRSQPFSPSLLLRGWMPPHPTVFMKKEIYEKKGGYDASFSISADYDFMLRVFNDISLHCVYLPQIITKMRMGGTSNRNIKNILIKSKEDYRALQKNGFSHAWWILLLKNISKVNQFLSLRRKSVIKK